MNCLILFERLFNYDNVTYSSTRCGYIHAILAFLVTRYNCSDDKELARRKLAKALKAEISSLIKLYQANKLETALPQEGSDISIVKIECNYLSVFENNTDKIGIFDEDDIAEIISFYMQTKGLIDTLSVLSERWSSYAMYSRTGMSD